MTDWSELDKDIAAGRKREAQELARVKLLQESKDKKLLDYEGYGSLWYLEIGEDEPLVYLEDRERDPDNVYFFRVPPDTKTVNEAFEWTRNWSVDDG